MGRTVFGGRVALKLTLVNPSATHADIEALLALIAAAGASTVRRRGPPGCASPRVS